MIYLLAQKEFKDVFISFEKSKIINKIGKNNHNSLIIHEFENEEELFLKMLKFYPDIPYWEIIKLMKEFKLKFSNDFLIKSYVSKSNRIKQYKKDYLYLILKNVNEESTFKVLRICTLNEFNKYYKNNNQIKDTYIKVRKEYIPIFLSLFLNKFTYKDFYFCTKNITGIKNVPTLTSSNTFFIIKYNSKPTIYLSSKEGVNKMLELIKETNNEGIKNNLQIHKADTFEELIDEIDKSKIQKDSDFEKYLIDFDWILDGNFSKKQIDIRDLNFEKNVFLIRNKTGETVAKQHPKDMFNFIKENKLYTEDIYYLENDIVNYNIILKTFEIFKEELSFDAVVYKYLSEIKYIDKVNLINVLIDKINKVDKAYKTNKPKGKRGIYYSLISTTTTNSKTKAKEDDIKLFLFSKIERFHSHITGLEYGTDSLSYGELDIKPLRVIADLINKEKLKNNTIISRIDVALNITNLFKKEEEHGEYLKYIKDLDCIVDVDAHMKNNKTSCGVVIRDYKGDMIAKISKKLDATSSVEAEIMGAMFAIDYISKMEPSLNNICLRYDCFSIADYLINKPKSNIAFKYHALIKRILKENSKFNLYIKKVKGHSSDTFNDIADALASNFYN